MSALPDLLINLFCALYRLLLLLYPAEFREEYGRQMVQLFRDQCQEEARRRGSLGLIQMAALNYVDLFTNLIDEHLDILWLDLRYAARVLRAHTGFAAVAVLTLALGFGFNTATFSVVNAVLLRALPFPQPERLVALWEASERNNNLHVSHPDFIDWREMNRSFEYISAYSGRWGGPSTVIGGSEPDRAYVSLVYRDFFSVMGVPPALGRVFAPEESVYGTTPVCVISYGFWQRSLAGDQNLAGKQLNIEGTTFNVIGVMPADYSFPEDTEIWVSKEQLLQDTSTRTASNFIGIARLKAGVTPEQAQADMTAIAQRIEQAYPAENRGRGIAVIPLQDQMAGPVRTTLWALFAAVALVMLIACANVSNLLLARSLARKKELTIRVALGAKRSRIMRQLFTESSVLSLLGCVTGTLMAYWLVRLFTAFSPIKLPTYNAITIDTRVMAFTLAMLVITTLIFGLIPALRLSNPDLVATLKSSGQNLSNGKERVGSLIVIAEVAVASVLLIGAGLLVKSFVKLMEVAPGFNAENVLVMQLSLPASLYKDEPQTVAFYREFFERIENQHGITAAGMINNLPMGGISISGSYDLEGEAERTGYGGFRIISPGYFQTMEIPILKGRAFTAQDNERSTPVAIVSQRFAAETWPNTDAIGKRIRSGMDNRVDVWMTVVGVAGDVRHGGLEAKASSEVYVPYVQRPMRARTMSLVFRSEREPAALIAALREQMTALNRNLPVSFESMEKIYARTVASRRYTMLLFGLFALLAVTLSVIGIYGVLSCRVTQNQREIGIRMALGAQRAHILILVISHALVLAAVGVIMGLGGSLVLARLIASLLFGISATDPLILAAVPALMLLVALLASYLPARRATRVDPLIALHSE